MKILLLDSNALMTEVLQDFLNRRGDQVQLFQHSEELLTILRSNNQPDVLLAEQGWALNHSECLDMARAIHSNLDLVLIYDRGHSDVAGVAQVTGACAFLRQPLILAEVQLLLELVRKSRLLHGDSVNTPQNEASAIGNSHT